MSEAASGRAAALAPYGALIEHAERELELAGNGDLQGLTSLADAWDELVADLPRTPPPEAGPLLERAELMHERTRIELARVRDALLGELATARRARRTAAGYAGNLRPRPRLDRSV
jgi:hypothetical protein